MRHLIVLIALTLPAAASGQDCLMELDGCHICVATNGELDISGCGGVAGCAGLPPALLDPPLELEPGSLQEMLGRRILTLWSPGNAVYDVLTDPRRNFLRRATWEVVGALEADACGPYADVLRAAELRLRALAVHCAGFLVVKNIPDGTGGTAPAVVPQSGSSRGQCSGALLGWLPRQLGGFTDRELAPFVTPGLAGDFGTTDHEELLLGLAAQWRKLSPEDRAEVVDHAALMGADPEGGRE